MTTSREHYSPVSLTLHWVTAALVLAQPLLVWISEFLSREEHRAWVGIHKSIGATLLILTLVRLAYRLVGNPTIPMPDQMPGWEKFMARATHFLLYALLIGLPLGGWIASTAQGRPVTWFGIFNLPPVPFVPADKDLGRTIMDLHKVGGFVIVGLVVLHILAALKHFFVDKDNVLQRMLPFLPRRSA